MNHRYTIEEIKAMLEARVDELARELVPDGHKDGHHWRADTPWGGRGQSFCITLSGAKQGLVKDFAAGKATDLLGLVAQLRCAGKIGDAIKWSLSWLGLEHDARTPEQIRHTARQAEAARAARIARDAAEEKARAEKAYRRWQALKVERKEIAGTPVEFYLKRRGIDLRLLGRQPGALVFDPQCYCFERYQALRAAGAAEEDAQARCLLPAMVALVNDLAGSPLGVHRTWLEQDEGGHWTKARLQSPKKSLGPIRGGMIKLHRGRSGLPLQDAPKGSAVLLGEGIENSLGAALAQPGYYAVSGISLSNMASIELPATVEDVIVLGENDPLPTDPGLTATERQAAIEREAQKARVLAALQRPGRRVRLYQPPKALLDLPINDLNDHLRVLRRAPDQGAAA